MEKNVMKQLDNMVLAKVGVDKQAPTNTAGEHMN